MSVCYDHLWSNGILLIATAMDPMLVILSSNHVGTSSSAPEEPKNTGLRLSACTREEETWRHLVTASFDQRNNSCSIGPDRTSHVVSWYHVINCNNGFYLWFTRSSHNSICSYMWSKDHKVQKLDGMQHGMTTCTKMTRHWTNGSRCKLLKR